MSDQGMGASAPEGAAAPQSAAPSESAEHRQERRERLLEYVAAFLLGVGAVAIAWASFQSALYGGDQASGYTEAIRTSDAASQQWTEASQADANDEALFLEWAKAINLDQTDLATYIHDSLMRPELQQSIEWWANLPAETQPDSPFVDDNPYWTNAAADNAEALDAQADAQFAAGSKANDIGDQFTAVTVFLALALFLLGIGAVLKHWYVRLGLIAVAVVVIIYSGVQLVQLGIH